jgi:hypothetical protein
MSRNHFKVGDTVVVTDKERVGIFGKQGRVIQVKPRLGSTGEPGVVVDFGRGLGKIDLFERRLSLAQTGTVKGSAEEAP